MKYFIDTEFLEGTQREKFPISLFRRNTLPTIDLISIGIMSNDGNRSYYAISKDFNLDEAWNRYDRNECTPYEKANGFSGRKVYWIRENVLKPIWLELFLKDNMQTVSIDLVRRMKLGYYDKSFTYKSFKALVSKYGKSNNEIAKEVKDFCGYDRFNNGIISRRIETHDGPRIIEENEPEFYAYYADYDWVAFCWLFGKMMDLPKGFPKYCRDLKQMMDDYISETWRKVELSTWGHEGVSLKKLKSHQNYPKQYNEHDALSDAKWNRDLYNFLKNL